MNSSAVPHLLLRRSIPRAASRSSSIPKQSPEPSTYLRSPSRPLLQPLRQKRQPHPRRYFQIPSLTSLFSSPPNNNNNNSSSPDRHLTATRTLPFPPSPLFRVISSVESYHEFLPFLGASTVTARDPATGYPKSAYLTVGYGPFSETFTSRVDCDREKWVVEARSGAGFDRSEGVPGKDEGLFEYLNTRWQLIPLPAEQGQQPQTKVQLDIRFRFRSQLHAAMMSAVEGQMAQVMIEAFEKRVREIDDAK